MDSAKLINLFEMKKGLFFYHFGNKFLGLLLCKINVFGIFYMGDFLKIFVISRRTEILSQYDRNAHYEHFSAFYFYSKKTR